MICHRIRRTSLVVLLLLLASVGTASADGGWVLWLVWGGSFQKTAYGGLLINVAPGSARAPR